MRSIPKNTEQRAIFLLEKGLSTRQVANKLNISQSTAQKLRKNCKNKPIISKGGRRSSIDGRLRRVCIKKMSSGKVDTASNLNTILKEDFGVHVSNSTIRRALRQAGLKAKEKVAKPMLSATNIRKRLAFAKAHKHWTVEDWKRVIFSDETKINRFQSDGRSWTWFRDGESLQARHVKQTVKHGGGNIMLWGCMGPKGPGVVYEVVGRMNQEQYKQILSGPLMMSLQKFLVDQSNIVFQHDNDPKHTAKSVKKWLQDNEFTVLEWPPQSPDLNPIENLWAIVKRRLNQYPTPPSGMNELWERASDVFVSITAEDCRKLYESMPRRMAAVIRAKGRWTKY